MGPIVPPQPAETVRPVAPVSTARSAPAHGAAADFAVLSQLSQSDLSNLIRILEQPALPQARQAAPAQNLLQNAAAAAQAGDVDRALQHLAEFVKVEPLRADSLRTEPSLEQMRREVEQLLVRVEAVGRLDAQGRIADAARIIEQRGLQPLPGWDAAPQVMLSMANRLYDSGGYVNYVQAASLAQVVIDGVRTPESIARTRAAKQRTKPAVPRSWHRLKALWVRAPLLILLVTWFAVGLAAVGVVSVLHYFWPAQYPLSNIEDGFALWGIGFLALVGVGFYLRVRRVRFR